MTKRMKKKIAKWTAIGVLACGALAAIIEIVAELIEKL